MKKLLTAAAVAVGLAFAPAQAAVLDFANEADTNGERGLTNGSSLTLDGVTVTLGTTLSHGGIAGLLPAAGGNPYLDAGNAGLGVCQMLDGNDQCDPGSDDSIQAVNNGANAEGIVISFNQPTTITDLLFVDGRHDPINAMNDGMVGFANGDNFSDFQGIFAFSDLVNLAQSGDVMFQDVTTLIFIFVDKAFYVSSVTVSDVPIPGAIPLLISGLAGLGFASREKKKTA